jgi:hypothetical protein
LPFSAKMLGGILPQISPKSKITERQARKANTAMQNLIKQTMAAFPAKVRLTKEKSYNFFRNFWMFLLQTFKVHLSPLGSIL